MSCYRHLTIIEREKILIMLEKGKSKREIGRTLGRSCSTISREIKRNNKKYSAALAHKRYEKCRLKSVRKHRLETKTVYDKVVELLEKKWSPEQISMRLRLEKNAVQISMSTIYRGIKKGLLPKSVKQHLRTRPYHKPKGSKTGQLVIEQTIHDRGIAANKRMEIGHFESDTVRGAGHSGCIATHVDRKSRYLLCAKLKDRTTNEFMGKSIEQFLKLPKDKVKSFTTDHGKEFAGYRRLTQELGAPVYFADPAAPGQRGTNENTNGLLRQFFPKRTSFKDVTQADVESAAYSINTRPKKCLGWKSPFEVFFDLVLHFT